MTDDVENIILQHLRAIRAKLDQLTSDGAETRTRLAHLEEQSAHSLALYATLSSRIDKIGERLDRIEKRLELVE